MRSRSRESSWTLCVLICIFSIATASTSAIAAPPSGVPVGRPDWCRPGYECIPTADLADATEQLIRLRTDLAAAKAKVRHWGLTAGFNLGVGAVTDENFRTHIVPTGGFGISYGWRF